MEKLTGAKHNHLFTDLVKVFIFGLMLLLPFLCFLPTGFYYGFNEHATNETTTTINYKYQSNEVNTFDDLVIGNIYFYDNFVIDYNNVDYNEYKITFYQGYLNNYPSWNINGLENQDNLFNDFYLQIKGFEDKEPYLYFISNNTVALNVALTFLPDSTFEIQNAVFSIDNQQAKDLISIFSDLPTYTDYNVIESVDTNVQDTISNKMYQAWEGVWQSPLFNWTNNTPLNTSLNGFISIFGISTNSYIGNALIWLLTITAIYIVIDIVIGIFKWLTHLIGNK